MKCHYCQNSFPMSQIMFIEDGMVPGIQMKRSRAHCGCPIDAIDGKPGEPVIEREPGSDDEPATEEEPPF